MSSPQSNGKGATIALRRVCSRIEADTSPAVERLNIPRDCAVYDPRKFSVQGKEQPTVCLGRIQEETLKAKKRPVPGTEEGMYGY